MAKARAIVKRRKAVRNIRKITKTMQMIATAKFQKSLKRAVGTKPFTTKVRELVRQDFANAFEKVDAIISPTSPVPAFKLGERVTEPLQMYLADVFTIAANLAGICGISVPCGFAEVDGHRLPIGLQLLGKALDEARILQIAHAYEQSTDWHKARPPIGAKA